MAADNAHPVTDVGESRNTCIDDFCDEDILTEKRCQDCGARIISHQDCTHSCSNDNCESHHIRIDV